MEHDIAPDHEPATTAPARADKRTPVSSHLHLADLPARTRTLVHAIQENDDAKIEAAIRRLSQSRRWLAPLAFAVGAFLLLFDGLRLTVSNWRLTLVQVLPAMWIWLAMYDLKAHVLRGKEFNVLRGPILIPPAIAIVALTVASFFLNAVFAFAIAAKRPPRVRPAVAQARGHLQAIVLSGVVVGLLLAFATLISTRWGRPWFTLLLGVVVGLMMVAYVAVPARLIGAKPKQSRRDKLVTSAVGGAIGATVCGPPYLLGRLGLLMLGSFPLLIPGIFVFATGITLQAGATGAVRAIKMSAKLGTSGDPAGARPSQVS
jgi:putative flippase GtrA